MITVTITVTYCLAACLAQAAQTAGPSVLPTAAKTSAPIAQNASGSAALAAAQALYAQGLFAEAEAADNSLNDGDKYSVAGLQLRAELELSVNNLAAAQADLLQARRLAIHDKKTLELLALAFARANRFAEAAPFYEQAGSYAEGAQAEALSGREAYRVEGLGIEDRIRLLRVDPLPVMAVRLNGGDLHYFLVDTGGPQLLLDDALARSLDIEDLGTTEGTFAGGERQAVGHGVLASFAIGSWKVHDVPVILKSTAAYRGAGGGLTIEGVVGTEFLAQFCSTLDYRHAELRLKRKAPVRGADTAADLKQHMAAVHATAVPIRFVGDHFILAAGTVNGSAAMQFVVDTGLAGSGFTAPDSTWKAAGVVRDQTPVQAVTLRALTLGAIEEAGVPAIAGPFPPTLETSTGVRIGGLVSHAFFREYAVTFDFANMTLWMER